MEDAVVVGSGPNGLAAAVALARSGASVRVLEARDEIGGGTRSTELTLPGFLHDVCSGCHPMGALSPFFRELPLEEHGLRWIHPPASVAHPLDGQPAVLLRRSLKDTARELNEDGDAYSKLFAPLLRQPHALLADLLGPLRVPKHPLQMARFGLPGLLPATVALRARFRGLRARAVLAGCAAHSILPLERPLTAAVGMIFALTAHIEDWPVAAGGSQAITGALASYLRQLGGRVETGVRVRSLADIPPARVVLFDTSPAQIADVCEPLLPAGYVRRLRRYRYGPGVFKLDWALDGPIPWSDPRCLDASTVHLGGRLEEIAAAEAAVWRGEHPERPFVLVVQQSQFDPSRAPAGKHTGYAYCHVPARSNVDCTAAIEQQIERFAPGFRERILARHVTRPADLERENPNYIGGAITGGVADLFQFFTRPVARLDPYSTPHPRLFICSASTPPGGGVHGMCGYFAAQSARRTLDRLSSTLPDLIGAPRAR
ncbi:MAG TPA: NAD(P)/FAD-dependent oxidoreductase [Candidatus Acidoferrales bacterium]|nr:NAD(P)/FAD-dependent oxidoreductase [Candidatus Acidoferrales bacterium]